LAKGLTLNTQYINHNPVRIRSCYS